jgi:hypothetical protein
LTPVCPELEWRVKLVPVRPAGILLLLAMPLLVVPSVAHAYLDPGTGSYAVQLLVGSLLGGLFAIGLFWRRVVAFVKRLLKRGGSNDGSR